MPCNTAAQGAAAHGCLLIFRELPRQLFKMPLRARSSGELLGSLQRLGSAARRFGLQGFPASEIEAHAQLVHIAMTDQQMGQPEHGAIEVRAGRRAPWRTGCPRTARCLR